MISWFNSWAQGIILAVIIVTILEMIVPEGKNKKYIKYQNKNGKIAYYILIIDVHIVDYPQKIIIKK